MENDLRGSRIPSRADPESVRRLPVCTREAMYEHEHEHEHCDTYMYVHVCVYIYIYTHMISSIRYVSIHITYYNILIMRMTLRA